MELKIRKCLNSSEIICASEEEIAKMETSLAGFQLNFYFINPLINPSAENYISHYLEDGNFFPFTRTVGSSSNVFFSPFRIKTDKTIFPEPISDKAEIEGSIALQLGAVNNFQVTSNEYLRLYMRKTANEMIYERSYKRIDATLSYIGGLFGSIILLLFFMRFYN